MAFALTITDAAGGDRLVEIAGQGSETVSPGDWITFADTAISDADFQVLGDQDVSVAIGDDSVVFNGLYGFFEEESDVGIHFGGGGVGETIDGLGAFLAHAGLAEAASGHLDHGSDIVLVRAGEADAGDISAAGPEALLELPDLGLAVPSVFVDVAPWDISAIDQGFFELPMPPLGEMLDLGLGGRENDIVGLDGYGESTTYGLDYLDGYYAPISIGGATVSWAHLETGAIAAHGPEWQAGHGSAVANTGFSADQTVGWGLVPDLDALDPSDVIWLVS